MNKAGVCLITFVMLLSLVMVPSGPALTTNIYRSNATMKEAATTSSGRMKILVAEDVGVVNGSYADMNLGTFGELYVGTADESPWTTGRSWFKFNLAQLPSSVTVVKATMYVYVAEEWSGAAGNDEPVGVYPCADDNWDDMVITWNTQPTFSSTATDVIDSPASPNMFEEFNWYGWDITTDVSDAHRDNKILTEVLKQVTEWGSSNAFWYPYDSSLGQTAATYLDIEYSYSVPTTSALTVDGIASGPLLDYIHSSCPDLGWTFSDPDGGDVQKDYDVEVWNNQYYNDSLIWKNSHEYRYTIHDSFGVGAPGNTHPFSDRQEFKMQMKYPSSMLPQSGIVDKLYFASSVDSGTLASQDLEISMVMVEDSADLTTDLEANLDGRQPTIVLSRNLYQLQVVDGIIAIDVENTFMVNKDLNLIIQIRLMNNTADAFPLNRTVSGGPGSVATAYGVDAYDAPTADYTSTRTYDLKIGFLTKTVFSGQLGNDNGFPFGTTAGYGGRFQIKYNQSYIGRAGYIDKAFMQVYETDGDVELENFKVTLVESPVEGPIENGTWTANYGGATPKVVINEANYTLKNLGGCIVLDFANTFYYSNTHDLLIDIQWDSLVSGALRINCGNPASSSYRAWDLHYAGDFRIGSGTAGYDLMLDFIDSKNSIPLEGCITLVNATRYYWRARTCDSLGMWSDWVTNTFKYESRSEVPAYTEPIVVPEGVRADEMVTVSLNVTHSLGIYQVTINMNGTEYVMDNEGIEYSFDWTPTAAGTYNFTISMQSNADTWSYANGSVYVLSQIGAFDPIPMLIIGGVVAVVIVVLVVVLMKRKPAK